LVASSPYAFALVVADDGTLVGRLKGDALADSPDAHAEQVMEAGPTTVRPDRRLAELVDAMRKKQIAALPVTDPEGRLLGVLPLQVGEQTLEAAGPDQPRG
jgi:CBS domain-containing protein